MKFMLVGLCVMMDMFNDMFKTLYNFPDFFYSAFKQYVVSNKQNAGCSHFFWPPSTVGITCDAARAKVVAPAP